MKKIILCTTFRDFKGTENDNIQRLFLNSIASQTYKNFELVVTLFGEKNVQNEVEKYDFPSCFYSAEVNDCRYTLTSVVNNAIGYAIGAGEDYILLWSTCDVVYDINFFQEIVELPEINLLGTSHPHVIYKNVEDYVTTQNSLTGKLFCGFDLIFFDSSFLDNEVRNILQNYKFYDWGVFEHFLIALAEVKQKNNSKVNFINIYETSKISKIENDRQLTNEPSVFLIKSHERNTIELKRFLSDYKLSYLYFDLTYCHLKSRVNNKSLNHYWVFKRDIIEYLSRLSMFYLRFYIEKFYIAKITKDYLKKMIRGRV